MGYRTVPLSLLLSDRRYTRGHFAVTFDDAYVSVETQALPILRRYGLRGTLFVVAEFIGQTNRWDELKGDRTEPLMSTDDLRELLDDGFELGSHTMTHQPLATLSPDDAWREISGSKSLLEDTFKRPITCLAYPHGSFNAEVKAMVRKAGYVCACSTRRGTIADPPDDRLAVPRLFLSTSNIGPWLQRTLRQARRPTTYK